MVYQTPVIWAHPGMWPLNLGILADGVSAFVSGINSSAQVVGYAFGGPTGPHPFVWQKGTLTERSYPETYPGNVGMGQAYAINDKGEIAGVTGLPNPGPFEATLWDNKGRASQLGTLGGEAPFSFATSRAGPRRARRARAGAEADDRVRAADRAEERMAGQASHFRRGVRRGGP